MQYKTKMQNRHKYNIHKLTVKVAFISFCMMSKINSKASNNYNTCNRGGTQEMIRCT